MSEEQYRRGNINLAALVTAEDKSAAAQREHIAACKSECANRITDFVDAPTLMNLHGAVLRNALSRKDMARFDALRGWIAAMQRTCRHAARSGATPNWPAPPEDVAQLVAAF